MPIIKEPLNVNCFQCKNTFAIKYVPAQKNYSKKNNWDYWTKDAEIEGKKICDNCLIKLYRNYKWEFRKLISDDKKQRLLRQYIAVGTISGISESTFILPKKKQVKNNESKHTHTHTHRERERERERERAKWKKLLKS